MDQANISKVEDFMNGNVNAENQTTVINIPEAVGVFDSFDDLQKAFYDLRMVGFSRYDISLLGKQEVLEEKLGKAYWRIRSGG